MSLSAFVSVELEGAGQAISAATPDPRGVPSFPMTGPQPGANVTRISAGQTRSVGAMAQLPFEASNPVNLHACAGLGVTTGRSGTMLPPQHVVGVVADVPLRVTAPAPTDHLSLDLKADRQQWCLRATTAGNGARPDGPLFVCLQANGSTGGLMESAIIGGTGDAWSQRRSWTGSPSLFESPNPVTITVWVAGPHCVTARAHATFAANL